MNRKEKFRETTKPMWRFTKEGMKKFSRLTVMKYCVTFGKKIRKNIYYVQKNLKRYSANALKEYIQKSEKSGRQ